MTNANKKHIVIRGAYGVGNFGDDALAHATIGMLGDRFYEGDIGLQCPDVPYLSKLFPGLEIVSQFDTPSSALIYGGGTQFCSFKGSSTHRVSHIISVMASPRRTINYLRRRLSEVEYSQNAFQRIGLGLGFGPFENGSVKEGQAIQSLNEMNHLYVRDGISYDWCRNHFKGSIDLKLGTDVCFLSSVFSVPQPEENKGANNNRLGIVVRDWKHNDTGSRYPGPLVKAVEKVRDNGSDVQYILFSQGDHEWKKRLDEMGEDYLEWNPERQTIQEFVFVLSTFDYFVSARFHGLIFALMLRKPVIAINIEPKLGIGARYAGGGVWGGEFLEHDLLSQIDQLDMISVGHLTASLEEQNLIAEEMKRNLFDNLSHIETR